MCSNVIEYSFISNITASRAKVTPRPKSGSDTVLRVKHKKQRNLQNMQTTYYSASFATAL